MSSSSSASAPAVAPIDALSGGERFPGNATLLMSAARLGSKRTLDKLIAKGASVQVRNSRGFTAMHFAAMAKSDNSDIIRELHAQGLSVTELANHGVNTPISLVQNAASATTLIELGANPQERIHHYEANAPLLKALLIGGGTVTGEHCWYAVACCRPRIVEVILEHGHIDLSYVRYYGETIVQQAWKAGLEDTSRRSKYAEIIEMLREAGAPDEVLPHAPGRVYGLEWPDEEPV